MKSLIAILARVLMALLLCAFGYYTYQIFWLKPPLFGAKPKPTNTIPAGATVACTSSDNGTYECEPSSKGYSWVLLCADHSEVSLNAPHYWIPTKEEQEDGCRKHGGVAKEIHLGNVVSNIDPPPSHEAQVYAELWRVCKERGLTFRVNNSYAADGFFTAIAWDENGNSWMATKLGPTEAAELLIQRLKGEPTWHTPPPPQHPFDTGQVKP